MNCPHCQHPEMRVIETRHDTSESILRIRRCLGCEQRFYSCEVTLPADAIRRSGRSMRRADGYESIDFF